MACSSNRNIAAHCWAVLLILALSDPLPVVATVAPLPAAAPRLFLPRARLTLINGVAHSLAHVLEASREVSQLFGGQPVDHCHNPTAMKDDDDYYGWGLDLTQAGTQKLGRHTSEVDSLIEHLRESLDRAGPNGRVVHIAHSQGALITRLAVDRMDPDELRRVEVIAFGGGAALRRSPESPLARCVNYYSVNDPILAIVPSAERALRSGFLGGARGIGVGAGDGGADEDFAQEEPEFVFLTPRGGDPIEDHQLLGPTYGEALVWEGRRFVTMYQPAPYRASKAFVRAVGPFALSVHRANVAVLKRTVVPLILALMAVLDWLKTRCKNLARTMVLPLFALLQLMWEGINEVVRNWRGDEERYDPVPTKSPA